MIASQKYDPAKLEEDFERFYEPDYIFPAFYLDFEIKIFYSVGNSAKITENIIGSLSEKLNSTENECDDNVSWIIKYPILYRLSQVSLVVFGLNFLHLLCFVRSASATSRDVIPPPQTIELFVQEERGSRARQWWAPQENSDIGQSSEMSTGVVSPSKGLSLSQETQDQTELVKSLSLKEKNESKGKAITTTFQKKSGTSPFSIGTLKIPQGLSEDSVNAADGQGSSIKPSLSTVRQDFTSLIAPPSQVMEVPGGVQTLVGNSGINNPKQLGPNQGGRGSDRSQPPRSPGKGRGRGQGQGRGKPEGGSSLQAGRGRRPSDSESGNSTPHNSTTHNSTPRNSTPRASENSFSVNPPLPFGPPLIVNPSFCPPPPCLNWGEEFQQNVPHGSASLELIAITKTRCWYEMNNVRPLDQFKGISDVERMALLESLNEAKQILDLHKIINCLHKEISTNPRYVNVLAHFAPEKDPHSKSSVPGRKIGVDINGPTYEITDELYKLVEERVGENIFSRTTIKKEIDHYVSQAGAILPRAVQPAQGLDKVMHTGMTAKRQGKDVGIDAREAHFTPREHATERYNKRQVSFEAVKAEIIAKNPAAEGWFAPSQLQKRMHTHVNELTVAKEREFLNARGIAEDQYYNQRLISKISFGARRDVVALRKVFSLCQRDKATLAALHTQWQERVPRIRVAAIVCDHLSAGFTPGCLGESEALAVAAEVVSDVNVLGTSIAALDINRTYGNDFAKITYACQNKPDERSFAEVFQACKAVNVCKDGLKVDNKMFMNLATALPNLML